MASNPRKRPTPTSTNGTNHANPPLTLGIDTLLAKYARHLPPGGTVTVTLVKGPTSSSVDPIAARKAAAALAKAGGGSDGEGSSTGALALGKKFAGATVPLPFPRVAKFPETVTKPDFLGDGSGSGSLRDGRMYEEDDESDEEESTAYRPSNDDPNGDGTDPNSGSSNANKKRKKRWRKHDVRPRRWVVQEKAEFFERIAARRRRQRRMGSSTLGEEDDAVEAGKLSNQYHGVAESNTSKYVILSVAPPTSNTSGTAMQSTPSSKFAAEQISVRPIYGFHNFSQPYKFASLTMEEAENAIEQQRNVVTRYMMHGRLSSQAADKNEAAAAIASGVAVTGRGNRPMGPPPKAMSRARLLGKLAGGEDKGGDDDDDIMGDVKFANSRGTSKARRELLSSMADEGVTVDDDGVLGGANDSEFGGRRRFARVAVDKSADVDDGAAKKKGEGGEEKGGGTATGFEAGAMEEGFYQRDVSAEYEALDYDANEQFDDDDINLGEDEINDDGGGYGGDLGDSGDDMFDSEDEDGSDDEMFKGMASSSGLKAMIAKARGELPSKPEDGAATTGTAVGTDALDGQKGDSVEGETTSAKGEKGINKIMDAAKKTAEEMEKKKTKEAEVASPTSKEVKAVGIEKDKDGLRVISMEAVRREIWLNSGAIKAKRLMKKFDVTNKYPERQALFKQIVMELCTMKKDADGNKLVLKQHYAKSG
ncbi:hypothetical protein ACHAXS_012603 [Conticribra weissflogii]